MFHRFASMLRNQWMGALALFLVLTGGTAMAVDGSLPGQNTVGSQDIINGEVMQDDLAANSIGSGKIVDGPVKNQDLSAGASNTNTIQDGGVWGVDVKDNSLSGADLDDSSLDGGQIPGTTARAYGKVTIDGIVTDSKNVTGDATFTDVTEEPTGGIYCIPLDPSIDAETAVIIPETNFDADSTGSLPATLGWAKPGSPFHVCEAENTILVATGTYSSGSGRDSLNKTNQPFYFVVP